MERDFYYFLKNAGSGETSEFPYRTDEYLGEIGDTIELDGKLYIITDYVIDISQELIQMKFVPIEKQSKKAQRAYNAQKRGKPIPPSRRGKTPYEYKMMKLKLKGIE